MELNRAEIHRTLEVPCTYIEGYKKFCNYRIETTCNRFAVDERLIGACDGSAVFF